MVFTNFDKIKKHMTVWEALKKMRHDSETNMIFSIAFMSYSQDKNISDGIKTVARAKLLKNCTIQQNRNANLMINYLDLDKGEARKCYIPLLMFYNGVKLTF